MKRKQRKSLRWRTFGYVILIIIKFSKLLLSFSPRMLNALRSYIKHSKECFIKYPNTSKKVKITQMRLVFSTHPSVVWIPEATFFLVFDILHQPSASRRQVVGHNYYKKIKLQKSLSDKGLQMKTLKNQQKVIHL